MIKLSYKVAIIDDLEQGIFFLKHSLSPLTNIQIVGTATDGKSGETLIMELRPDLLFLDVEMPDMTGLELLRLIRNRINWPMQVVMYSSYKKYAIDAFREYAFDFLPKPYLQDEFMLVMERFFEYRKITTANRAILQDIDPFYSKFMITTDSGFQIVDLNEILYFEYLGEKKRWTVVLSNKSQFILKSNTNAESILTYSSYFVKINQSQIINITYLSTIYEDSCTLRHPSYNGISLKMTRSASKLMQQEFSQI